MQRMLHGRRRGRGLAAEALTIFRRCDAQLPKEQAAHRIAGAKTRLGRDLIQRIIALLQNPARALDPERSDPLPRGCLLYTSDAADE